MRKKFLIALLLVELWACSIGEAWLRGNEVGYGEAMGDVILGLNTPYRYFFEKLRKWNKDEKNRNPHHVAPPYFLR